MDYYNMTKKDLLVLANKKLDVIMEWTKKYPYDKRVNDLVREISGDIEVVEPANTFKRPVQTVVKCGDTCSCRKNGGNEYREKIPYA